MDRREFSKIVGLGAIGASSFQSFASLNMNDNNHTITEKIPLGVGNHSLRAVKPNAIQLIEYAIEHKLDSVQFNTLAAFESLEESYLIKVEELATSNDISIYVGIGSICEDSLRFNNKYGNAESLVKQGFRVSKILKSPALGVRIGVLEDRYTQGGIQPKMDQVTKLMKKFRQVVLDSGIKFAFENHAGDMRSGELIALINDTGTDICGAFYDPGNAIYAMENPQYALEKLGKYILCVQARDVMVWQSEEGATFQWTAVGEGQMDFMFITDYMQENCPGVPIHLETISNSPRIIPYLDQEYWTAFPNLRASEIVDFLKMAREGHQIEFKEPPAGMGKKDFDYQLQKIELINSFKFLRENCNVGLKT
jgi:3-oxoisoapionate decarboxylase